MPFELWKEPPRTKGRHMSAKTSLLFSATFGAAFLIFCLLCNLGLLLTVHGSVEAGYRQAKEGEPRQAEMEQQRIYFLALWVYNFICCFLGVPSIYMGMRAVVYYVTVPQEEYQEAPWLLNFIYRHSAIHTFLFLVMLLATWATSYSVGVDSTARDVDFFAVISFISTSTVYVASSMFVMDISAIDRHIAELQQSSNNNVQV